MIYCRGGAKWWPGVAYLGTICVYYYCVYYWTEWTKKKYAFSFWSISQQLLFPGGALLHVCYQKNKWRRKFLGHPSVTNSSSLSQCPGGRLPLPNNFHYDSKKEKGSITHGTPRSSRNWCANSAHHTDDSDVFIKTLKQLIFRILISTCLSTLHIFTFSITCDFLFSRCICIYLFFCSVNTIIFYNLN